MSERTEPIYVRVRPAIRDAVERDARARGQSITVWIERACMKVLGIKEADLEAAALED